MPRPFNKEEVMKKIKMDPTEHDGGEAIVQDKPESGGGGDEVAEVFIGRNDPKPMEEDFHRETEASPVQEPNTHTHSPSNDLPSQDHPMMEQQPNEIQLRGKGGD